MTEVAPSMSQKGTTLMSFLVVLPPVWGQLWCLSWWFCLLPGDNSDRCGIFWLGWLMDVGRYEGVAPSMWAFPAWFWRMSGSCVIYVPENDLFFAIFYALAICHFAWPWKTGPTKSPEKWLFPEFAKGNLTLGGVRFPERTQVENWHCAGFPPFFFSTSSCLFGHRWRNSNSFAKIRLGMPT